MASETPAAVFGNKYMGGVLRPVQVITDLKVISKDRNSPLRGYDRVQKLSKTYANLKTDDHQFFLDSELEANIRTLQGVFGRIVDAVYVHSKLVSIRRSGGPTLDFRNGADIHDSSRDYNQVIREMQSIGNQSYQRYLDEPLLLLVAVLKPMIDQIKGIRTEIEEICSKEIDEDVLRLAVVHAVTPSGFEGIELGYRSVGCGAPQTEALKRSIGALHRADGVGLEKLEKPKDMSDAVFRQLKTLHEVDLREMLDTVKRVELLFSTGIHWIEKKKRKTEDAGDEKAHKRSRE